MITFPKTSSEALAALATEGAAVRAGATDLQERRELGLHTGPLVDLRDLPDLDSITLDEQGAVRIGALVSVRQLQRDPLVAERLPGLAAAARGLATPQIRARATVGGNLLQSVRCWYWRTPAFTCLKKGGATCLARASGVTHHHACFDHGPCLAAHPSTLAVALLALEARVEVEGGPARSMAELMGDPGNPWKTHTLEAGALLTHVVVPNPGPGWQAAYHRTIQRSRSEWPLVEVFMGIKWLDGRLEVARVAIGGVANRPLRLTEVEKALVGLELGADPSDALALATEGAGGVAGTAWKVPLIPVALRDVWDKANAAPVTSFAAVGEVVE